MNQSRAFFISLAFAFLGMGLVYFYIQQVQEEATKENGDFVTVIKATRDINEMQVIDEDMLETVTIPSKFKNTRAFQPLTGEGQKPYQNVAGLVALVPISKGDQVLQTSVSPKGAETGLATQVSANKRAMSIEVSDETGVTKLIKPGDHVDIIGSIRYPLTDGTTQTELKTLLQNINILAVGEIVQNNIPQVFEKDPLTQKQIGVSGRGKRDFSTLTVEVTPEQAQVLLYAKVQSSQLYLTLRNPVDRVETSISTTTIQEVLGNDSKLSEARDREQLRIQEEARRAAAEAAAKQQQQQQPAGPAAQQGRAPASAIDPLEAGGGVLE